MRIGLFGFCFRHENKGCEALTYSFVQMLIKLCKNEPLEIYAFQISDLGKFEEKFPGVRFVSKNISIKKHPVRALKELRACDVLFDVTWGDGFSDIYYEKYARRVILEKEWCNLSGKPLILLPQTYGPFRNRAIERGAMHVIKNSAKVYSRDQLSADYIKNKCRKNVSVFTDLALYLDFTPFMKQTDKVRIGINVSGLLWNGGFHDKNQFGLTVDYQQYIRKLIEKLNESDLYEIHLIPHVIETVEKALDGDVSVCESLHREYPFTILAPAFETALDAKNYICSMDVFSGARMHSTIAAFSAGIPTIPFTYSRKFRGLYGNLNYSYLIEGNQKTTDEALEQTLKYIENRKALKKAVETSMKMVQGYLDKLLEELAMDLKMVK